MDYESLPEQERQKLRKKGASLVSFHSVLFLTTQLKDLVGMFPNKDKEVLAQAIKKCTLCVICAHLKVALI